MVRGFCLQVVLGSTRNPVTVDKQSIHVYEGANTNPLFPLASRVGGIYPKVVHHFFHLSTRTYFGNASNGTYHLAFPADTALERCRTD